jgi:hypothetical protein
MTIHCPFCKDEMITRNSGDLYCFACRKFYNPKDCNQYEVLMDDEQSRVTINLALEKVLND